MKKLFILFILTNSLIFSQVSLNRDKIIPSKYKPTSITVDKEGNIYAGSNFVGAVVKYNKDWKFQYTLKFKDIKNIADVFSYENYVYVLLGTGSVVIIDSEGKLINQLDFPKGNLLGELESPNGIYVDKEGIHICDTGNSRVIIMDFKGENLRTFGYKTVFEDGFIAPNGINKFGKYYVITDESTKEVKFFDKEGLYAGNLKNQEKEEVFLVSPEDIFVDSKNSIYIADAGQNQILVFMVDGKIKTIGEKGSTKNKFYGLKDIWVDDNYIYVADTMNKKIKILDKNTFTVLEVLGNKNIVIYIFFGVLALVALIFTRVKRIMKKKGEVIE